MKIINESLLNGVSAQAKASPRLRMTDIPIHRHPTKDESFVVLRGKVRSTTYNDDGSVIESVVLSQEDGLYGVDIPKNVWHTLQSLESNSVIFEVKEGPFVEHEVEGILNRDKS